MVKGGDFELLNAGWGEGEIIGGSLEVKGSLKIQG